MADYRKRLSDMTPEERAEVAPAADNFEKLFGDRSKTPTSVQAADVAVGLTPVGSAVEIGEELSKEDPSYAKIGVIAAGDVLGAAIPPAGIALKTLTGSGRGLVRDIDDLVDTWAKGDISNKELRDSAKELGVEINTKRITKNRDSSDIEITMPDGKIYTGVNTIPDEVVDPEYVKGLTKNAETDAIKELGLSDEALEAWKAENYAKDKFRIPPKPELMEAAEKLRDGKLTQEQYRKLSNQLQPIITIEEMPKFPSKEEVIQALHATDKRKVEKGIIGVNKTIKDGTPISARLDIPAYNDTDTWIVSLHDGTEKSGATVGYAQTAVLNDVRFTTNPLAASAIATGKPKTTIARMNGSYVNAEPEEVYNTAKQILEANPEDWTQVGMNPTRASFFYDKSDGMPVVSSDQVIQVGPLVFAKNVKKTTPDDEMFEFTNKRTGVTANFSEGGMAIEEQMSMNFGDVPDNTIGIDPVSGNEIPLGSTAENVRDDIPSYLSEGEIVVPADVVRFHGVKLFEDLRAEAKLGFQQMEEDGRIGGQPVNEPSMIDGMDIEITMDDLETMEEGSPMQGADEAFLGKFFAGIRESNRKQAEKNKQAARDKVRERFSAASKRDMSPAAIQKRAQASRNKPKTRFDIIKEQIAQAMKSPDSRSRRPTLTEKPLTSDDSVGPSIAEQINFGGDYTDKEETPKATPKQLRQQAPKRTKFVDESEEQDGVNLRSTESFGTKFMRGLGYDEGGDVTYAQKGGFDMEDAMAESPEVVLEMREYQNDQGHRIFITFINGEPQMPIPDGYYPVGEAEEMETPAGEMATRDDDDDSGDDPKMPQPVNYKELSLEDLTKMVETQGSAKADAIAAGMGLLNPVLGAIVKYAMFDQERQVKKEIQRRIDSPEVSYTDKMRYENLLELAKREKPNLLDRITGQDVLKEAEQIPKPVIPDVDYSDPTLAPYTPNIQKADDRTTPGVANPFVGSTYDEVTPQTKPQDSEPTEPNESAEPTEPTVYDPIPEAKSGFGGMGPDPAEEFAGSQTRFQQPAEPTVRGDSRQDRDSQRRRERQEANKNMAGQSTSRKTRSSQSATRGLSSKQKQGGAELDSRFGITGLHKGALVDKPKVKKVVKGLKKASKTHAKQADQLEGMMKKKSK